MATQNWKTLERKLKMVLISDTVKNVLNRIYLVGIAYNGNPPQIYGKCVYALDNLDKSIANIFATSANNVPFAWKRDKMLVCRVGRYSFSYKKDMNKQGVAIVVVEEVAENGQIITENKPYTTMNTTKKKNVVRLTESDLHSIIKQCVNEALNELDWKTYASADKKIQKDFNDKHPQNIDTWLKIMNGELKPNRGFDNAARKAFNTKFKSGEYDHYLNALFQDAPYDAQQEYNDFFFNDNYEYQRGKGWQLKDKGLDESIRRSIRKVIGNL